MYILDLLSIQLNSGVLHKLLERLHTAGILTEDLALPDYSKPLEAVYHGICRLPNVPGARRRRIDFLTVPYSSKGGALLYYTVRYYLSYYGNGLTVGLGR